MIHILKRWLTRKWQQPSSDTLQAYHATFSSPDGQLVLAHLLDNIYFQAPVTTDPNTALVNNARRSVIQEILVNIDAGEHPNKYNTTETEAEDSHVGPIIS